MKPNGINERETHPSPLSHNVSKELIPESLASTHGVKFYTGTRFTSTFMQSVNIKCTVKGSLEFKLIQQTIE